MTAHAGTTPDTTRGTTRGVAIAAPHTAAVDAAGAVLEQGGNLVDAVVAAAASLTVVYPHMCALGGDGIALLRDADGKVTSLNGSGAYGSGPSGLGDLAQMPLEGPRTVTVPGAVSTWDTLLQLAGTMSAEQVLAPAARQASAGFPVSPGLADAIAAERARLAEDAGMRSVFLPGGEPLARGTTLVQPQLAETLATLSEHGLRDFYEGRVAERLARGFEELGVPVLAKDLRNHAVDVGVPVATAFDGVRVSTARPNSQGYLLLEILSIVHAQSGGRWSEVDPALLAEVMWGADARRNLVLADPASMPNDVHDLLSPAELDRQASDARARLAGAPSSSREGGRPRATGDTVAITAVDRDGRAVSLIQSVFHAFGSGVLEPDTGIVLHNRGAFFTLEAGSPNVVRPGKRPAHTLMPVIVETPDGGVYAHGTMGGQAQPQIHAQLALGRFRGLAGQELVGAPRFVVGGLDAGSDRDHVLAEPGLDEEVVARLTTTRLPVLTAEPDDERVGHAMVAGLGPDGEFEAGADPRSDGGVLVLP